MFAGRKGSFQMKEKVWAGVDIGGTKTAIVLSSDPPKLLSRVEFATLPAKGPAYAIGKIQNAIHESLAANGLDASSLAAIGVSCGGPLDPVAGVIQAPPNLTTWVDIPITQILATEFAVRCTLENDANAGAVAEHRYGAGVGTRNMVFITMGTGLGAGVIIEGHLYRGASQTGGEIGHVRLTRSGPVGYYKAGSAEGWASGGGMVQVASRVLAAAEKRGQASSLSNILNSGVPLTARDIADAAQQGDVVAKKIIQTTGTRLGEILAIVVDLLNPERIVIGGLAMRLGESILAPARKVVDREALAPAAAVCEILPAQLGERIGDLAAICVAQGF
jgi:glucokinase